MASGLATTARMSPASMTVPPRGMLTSWPRARAVARAPAGNLTSMSLFPARGLEVGTWNSIISASSLIRAATEMTRPRRRYFSTALAAAVRAETMAPRPMAETRGA